MYISPNATTTTENSITLRFSKDGLISEMNFRQFLIELLSQQTFALKGLWKSICDTAAERLVVIRTGFSPTPTRKSG